MEKKFYICKHCGNIVTYVKDAGVLVSCCGEKMQEIVANTVDASREKHIPEVEVSNGKVTVTVGSVLHPMTEAHLIEWILLVTKEGCQRKVLKANAEPKAEFYIGENDEVVCVYAYCNLHGLWRKDL